MDLFPHIHSQWWWLFWKILCLFWGSGQRQPGKPGGRPRCWAQPTGVLFILRDCGTRGGKFWNLKSSWLELCLDHWHLQPTSSHRPPFKPFPTPSAFPVRFSLQSDWVSKTRNSNLSVLLLIGNCNKNFYKGGSWNWLRVLSMRLIYPFFSGFPIDTDKSEWVRAM